MSRPMADNSKHEDGPCRGEAPRPGRRIHVARLDARGRRQLDDPGGAALVAVDPPPPRPAETVSAP